MTFAERGLSKAKSLLLVAAVPLCTTGFMLCYSTPALWDDFHEFIARA